MVETIVSYKERREACGEGCGMAEGPPLWTERAMAERDES